MRKILIFCVLASFSFFLCRGPNEAPLRSPDLNGPVVTGIAITGEDSPEILGVYGKLTEAPKVKGYTLYPPYPNPCNGATSIGFEINKPMHCKIFIVPATFAYSGVCYSTFAEGRFQIAPGLSIRTLIDKDMLPGDYRFMWDLKDDQGQIVPNGFYRIYVQGEDNALLWQDALFISLWQSVPSELRAIVALFFPRHKDEVEFP